MKIRRRTRGFTIIELMIVISIVAVLASWALPNLRDLVLRTRLKSAASDLHTSLLFARSEAIKRNAPVEVLPVDDAEWALGWSVRLGATVFMQQDAYPAISFAPRNAAYGAKAITGVTFQGTGREGSPDGVAFILTAPESPSISARCVVLDPSGRPTVRLDRNDNPTDGCN